MAMSFVLNKNQEEVVRTVVTQFCKELSQQIGYWESDKAVVDAARLALITMGEYVNDEDVGCILCDAANNITKKVGWSYLHL